jgi:hypothetical protein
MPEEGRMPGVEEVKLNIAASVDDAERAIMGMRAVVERLDEALARLRIATAGSVHPRVADAIGQVERAKQKVEDAQTLALAGIQAAQSYHAII